MYSKLRWLLCSVALGLLLSVTSCGQRPTIVISLLNVPVNGRTARVLIGIDAKPTIETPQVDLADFAGGKDTAFRFGLHPPVGALGSLAVAVGIYDLGNCLVSAGSAELVLQMTDAVQELAINIADPPPEYLTTCRPGLPTIQSAGRDPTDPSRLVISGLGFVPDSQLRLDGETLAPVTWRGFTQLSVPWMGTFPPNGKRRVELLVMNPDGLFDAIHVDLQAVIFEDLAANTYALPAKHNPQAIAIGDLTGDGALDLVVAGLRDTTLGFVAIYANQGNGKFAKLGIYPMLGNASGLGIADFNKDGRLDIAATNSDADNVSIFLNNGDGTFPLNNPTVPAGPKPYYLETADIDSDGLTDIVVVNDPLSTTGKSQGSFLVSKGNGAFTPYINVNVMDILSPGLNVYGPLISADVNNDGRDDLIQHLIYPEFTAMGVVTHGAAATIIQNANGSFSRTIIFTDLNYGGIGIADINKDGRNDIVESGMPLDLSKGMAVRTFFQSDMGNFKPQEPSYPSGPRSTVRGTLNIGDLNGDGWPDLMVTNPSERAPSVLYILLNYKNGTYTDQPPPAYPFGIGEGAVTIGDLNQDGRLDVAIAAIGNYKDGFAGSLHVFLNATR